jgi:hypothetical protein
MASLLAKNKKLNPILIIYGKTRDVKKMETKA